MHCLSLHLPLNRAWICEKIIVMGLGVPRGWYAVSSLG